VNRTELTVEPGSLDDYDSWMKRSKNGDVLVYWRGDLLSDRESPVFDEKKLNTLNAIADRIIRAAKEGLLFLSQKRFGDFDYEYRATRIRTDHITGKKHVRDLVPA
jgi:hypothetical protein